MVEIQTKLWLTFCLYNNYGAKSVRGNFRLNICMRLTCDSDTNLIQELRIFMIPLGLIPILIPIPVFPKNYDSDSDFDSSIMCADSNSDSNKLDFDSNSGILFRFRNHLQLWKKYKFCLLSISKSQNWGMKRLASSA